MPLSSSVLSAWCVPRLALRADLLAGGSVALIASADFAAVGRAADLAAVASSGAGRYAARLPSCAALAALCAAVGARRGSCLARGCRGASRALWRLLCGCCSDLFAVSSSAGVAVAFRLVCALCRAGALLPLSSFRRSAGGAPLPLGCPSGRYRRRRWCSCLLCSAWSVLLLYDIDIMADITIIFGRGCNLWRVLRLLCLYGCRLCRRCFGCRCDDLRGGRCSRWGRLGRIGGGDFGRRFCGYFRRFANLRF